MRPSAFGPGTSSLASQELRLTDMHQGTNILRRLEARVHRDDRNTGSNCVLDGLTKRVRIRKRDDHAVRLGRGGSGNRLCHIAHVARWE